MRISVIGAIVILAAVCALNVQADEKPTRERWFLKLEHSPLRTVVLHDAGGNARAYHYMTMKVTNGTKFDRQWHPLVKAVTDTKQDLVAGGFTDALAAIRKAERKAGLVPIGTTAGKLKAGASVDTVAIFGPVDPLYDHINIQVFGLVDPIATYKIEQYGDKSTADNVVLGENSVVVDSAYWDRNLKILKRLKAAAAEAGGEVPQPHVEYQEVAESRYWSMDYERLGDEFNTEEDIIRFKKEGWKVKGDAKGLRVISTESLP